MQKRVESLTCAIALAFVVVFVVVVFTRLFYPFEVSWMESAMYEMTMQRLQGRSIYVAPSIDYTPCLYPPLYFDVSALTAEALGLARTISFLPMRLVSIVASLGTFGVTSWVAYRKRASIRWALGFGAIFLATYGRFEGWHDTNRVDSFYTFWLVAGAALWLEGRTLRSAALAGICFGAAVLTKQPAAPLAALAIAQSVVMARSIRRALAAIVTMVVIVAGYLVATGELFNPFFYYYLFEVPASHPLKATRLLLGVLFLGLTLPFLVIVVGASFRRGFAGLRSWTVTFLLWFVVLAILRAKQGADINFFLPLVPVAIVAAVEAMDGAVLAGSRPSRWLPYVPAAQLLWLLYDPRPYFPTKEDVREASELVERLREVDGPVWFPAFPSYPAFAGKPWFAHEVALDDLKQTRPGLVPRLLDERIRDGELAALITQPKDSFVDRDALAAHRLAPLPVPESPFLGELHRRHLTSGILLAPSSTSLSASAATP